MSCQHCESHLLAYLDRRLTPGETAEFERHLKGSADCRREAEKMRKAWHVMGYHPGLAPSGKLPGRMLEAARLQLAIESSWGWKLRKNLPLVASAAVILVVFCFTILWRPGNGQSEADRIVSSISDPEEREVVKNLDLYENLETVQNIDVLEDNELVEYLDLVQSVTDEDF